MIKIKIFNASEGDAFLLSLKGRVNRNVLIDMGLTKTYFDEIKPELLKIARKNEKIDLLVISHIDNDHIKGAVDFIRDNKNYTIVDVKEVWHNSYRHLQFDKKKKLSDEERNILDEIIKQNVKPKFKDGSHDIGFNEGSTLASLLYKYQYNWNSSFNQDAVCVENRNEQQYDDFKLLILSPNSDKLKKLRNKWQNKLDNIFYDFTLSDEKIFDDAFELFMQEETENSQVIRDCASQNYDIKKSALIEEREYSVSNGASISFIVEFKGKKLLFLADAHEDIIYENLSKIQAKGYKLNFEVVKISHHGSNKNISQRLIQLIDSKYYIISTNGKKHSHPNIEAIAKIVTKKTNYTKEIVFNYSHEKLKFLEDKALQEEYNFILNYKNEILIEC